MDIKEITYNTIADKLLGKSDSKTYVDWAVDLISKDFDSENLLILASLDGFDTEEAEHYFHNSLKDLNIEYPTNLKIEYDKSVIFSQSEAINDLIVMGYGNKFVIYDVKNNVKKFETSLEWYFSSFKIDGEDIFVASESELLKIKLSGKLEWTAKSLGIDGVIISKITEDEIKGEGEYDPPGGWKPFVVDRKTGNKK